MFASAFRDTAQHNEKELPTAPFYIRQQSLPMRIAESIAFHREMQGLAMDLGTSAKHSLIQDAYHSLKKG